MQNNLPTVKKPSGSKPEVIRLRAGAKYHPKLCDTLIDMAANGYSPLGFCGSQCISEKTYYNWLSAHPEFYEAHKIAKAIRVYFAETKLLESETSFTMAKALAILRQYGSKVWNPNVYHGGNNLFDTAQDDDLI